MKKIGIILSSVFIICIFSFLYFETTDFSGNWHFEGVQTDFSLSLTQQSTAITGRHCSILYSGTKIDCSVDDSDPATITGTASEADSVNLIFKTTVSDNPGQATIKRISATQIKWTITKEPEGEFFIPSNAILTKE